MRSYQTIFLACILLFVVSFGCTSKEKEADSYQAKIQEYCNDFVAGPDHDGTAQVGRLRFALLKLDFQPVSSGDTVVAKYPYKNVGERAVKISNIITSCECLKAEWADAEIAPGECGFITGYFFTEELQGRFERRFAVQIEGEEIPISLVLSGEVFP